jgi:hypothetical protein
MGLKSPEGQSLFMHIISYFHLNLGTGEIRIEDPGGILQDSSTEKKLKTAGKCLRTQQTCHSEIQSQT